VPTQPTLGGGEDLFERVFDLALGSREPPTLHVGAVAQQGKHARRAQLREARQVECLSVEGRLVDLEVARVEQHPLRRGNGHGHAVGHAVGDADELQCEGADRHHVARLHRHIAGPVLDTVLFDLGLDQRQCQRRAIDRAAHVRQHVRHRTDVILVAVRQDQRLHLAAARLEVGEVRDDEIHARQVGLGKHGAGVDDDGGISTRDRHHVEAELAKAAERHHVYRQRARGQTRRSRTRHAQNPSQRGARGRAPHNGKFRRWECLRKRRVFGRNYSTAG
jgi:hypothetical protein